MAYAYIHIAVRYSNENFNVFWSWSLSQAKSLNVHIYGISVFSYACKKITEWLLNYGSLYTITLFSVWSKKCAFAEVFFSPFLKYLGHDV